MDGNDDLPNEFDVIVVGTGMVESIVAASASRIGKTVLHLDRNMYYGDLWATLGLESLEEFAKAFIKPDEEKEPVPVLEPDSDLYSMPSSLPITNLAYKWFIPSALPEVKNEEVEPKKNESEEAQTIPIQELVGASENSGKTDDNFRNSPTEVLPELACEAGIEENTLSSDKEGVESAPESIADDKKDSGDKEIMIKEEVKELKRWSIELLKQQSRKFNIDLAPKVIYSGGSMVELLLRSCVHRYTEFQSVSKILTYMESSGLLEEVPCTKSQVFSCKTFSIVDKRILMKAINYCVNFNPTTEPNYDDLKDKIFVEVMKMKSIPEHLIRYVLHSVAMSTCHTSMEAACSRIKMFFNNVGRYGHSPFLWPLYGSGELLQAFCRLSAVYGGVYYLGRGVEAVSVSKETKKCSVVSDSKQIKAQHVISSAYTCPLNFITNKAQVYISRTILFTDRPLHEKTAANTKESIVILHMPCKDDSSTTPIEIVQLPPITGSCPKQLYVVQITCEQNKPCWSEVKEVIDKLFIMNIIQKTDLDCSLHKDDLSQQLIDKLTDPALKQWLNSVPDQNEEETDKPRILFTFHYNLLDTEHISFNETKPANLHFCYGPDTSIDFDRAIKQAKEIFAQMYPDDEFLEPTPDPNDITLSDLIGEEAITADDKQPEDVTTETSETELPRTNESEDTESKTNVDVNQSQHDKESSQEQKPVEE